MRRFNTFTGRTLLFVWLSVGACEIVVPHLPRTDQIPAAFLVGVALTQAFNFLWDLARRGRGSVW